MNTYLAQPQDPSKVWARNLKANVFSGGFAGCLLALTALVVMVASAIAFILLGFKVMGGNPADMRRRTLTPFALLGVPAGLLAFRVLTPVFYRISSAGRQQRRG